MFWGRSDGAAQPVTPAVDVRSLQRAGDRRSALAEPLGDVTPSASGLDSFPGPAPPLLQADQGAGAPINCHGGVAAQASGTGPPSSTNQALAPGEVLVATPAIEPQPWVSALCRFVAATTVGVARVDLRRPTFPWPEDYEEGNILFRRPHNDSTLPRRGRWRKPPQQQQQQQPPLYGYVAGERGADGSSSYLPVPLQQAAGGRQRTGARLKVIRCLQLLKGPQDKRALLDFGVGVGLDLDQQDIHGVARLKVADALSIKLLPRPLLKLGGAWRLPGGSGVAVRVKYEVPVSALGGFWAPPARLLVRLDNDVGSGIHLTPSGIEFDERRLALGNRTELRAGAALRFPRSLPVDRSDRDAFKLDVHRLSLRTLW